MTTAPIQATANIMAATRSERCPSTPMRSEAERFANGATTTLARREQITVPASGSGEDSQSRTTLLALG